MQKRLSRTALFGQQGVNLVERIVLSMGSAWHPTTALEAGIVLATPSQDQVADLLDGSRYRGRVGSGNIQLAVNVELDLVPARPRHGDGLPIRGLDISEIASMSPVEEVVNQDIEHAEVVCTVWVGEADSVNLARG